MNKPNQTFQSPYNSLHKPLQIILFHTTFLSKFVVKYLKISFFFWILQSRNFSLTKTTDSCSFLMKTYLSVLLNLNNITLSSNHSIMYVCCWRRNQRARNKLQPSLERFLLLLTKSPNTGNFCFSLYFMYLFCFFRFRFLPY